MPLSRRRLAAGVDQFWSDAAPGFAGRLGATMVKVAVKVAVMALALTATSPATEASTASSSLRSTRDTCSSLARDQQLNEVAAAAERILVLSNWQERMAADGPAWAAAGGAELEAKLQALLGRLRGYRAKEEIVDLLLADVLYASDRFELASRAYGRSARWYPGAIGRCGGVHGGLLITFENVAVRNGRDGRKVRRITGYLLIRNPETGQVVERVLLPNAPRALWANGSDLLLELAPSGSQLKGSILKLDSGGPSYPLWVADNALTRLSLPRMRAFVIAPFAVGKDDKVLPAWRPPQQPQEGMPADLATLEPLLRHAVWQDPTQPWNHFLLGQCLWFMGREQEAAAAWQKLLESGRFPAIPYYEFMALAWVFEYYRQPIWADAVYRQARERWRALPQSIADQDSSSLERMINMVVGVKQADANNWPAIDSERSYLWWQRLRQMSGITQHDAYISALWLRHFRALGDRQQAAREAAFLERARQHYVTQWSTWTNFLQWSSLATAASSFCLILIVGVALIARALTHRGWLTWLILVGLATVAGGAGQAKSAAFLPLTSVAGALSLWLVVVGLFDWKRSRCGWKSGASALVGLAMACLIGSLGVLWGAVGLPVYSSFLELVDTWQPTSYESLDTADSATRWRAALGRHVRGDFEGARSFYQSLPSSPRIEAHLAALDRRLPPVPSRSFGDEVRIPMPLPLVWLNTKEIWLRLKQYWQVAGYFLIALQERVGLSWWGLVIFALLTLPWQLASTSRVRVLALALVPGMWALSRGRPLAAYLRLCLAAFGVPAFAWLVLVERSPSVHGVGPWTLAVLRPFEYFPVFLPPTYEASMAEGVALVGMACPGAVWFFGAIAASLVLLGYLHWRDYLHRRDVATEFTKR